jgi:Protein of unknown function (DUF3347)
MNTMKKIVLACMAFAVIAFAACNSIGNQDEHEGHDMAKMKKDSMQETKLSAENDLKIVSVTYAAVNANVAVSLKKIVEQYLGIKNALANDNSSEASRACKEMEGDINGLDKSYFSSEQKKLYDEIEESLKEHTDHIVRNAGNIRHQRNHFAMMSSDIYEMVKAFGGGRELYHDYCKEYNDNKGAMWLSETKVVKNPYCSEGMRACGTVEEVIK